MLAVGGQDRVPQASGHRRPGAAQEQGGLHLQRPHPVPRACGSQLPCRSARKVTAICIMRIRNDNVEKACHDGNDNDNNK